LSGRRGEGKRRVPFPTRMSKRGQGTKGGGLNREGPNWRSKREKGFFSLSWGKEKGPPIAQKEQELKKPSQQKRELGKIVERCGNWTRAGLGKKKKRGWHGLAQNPAVPARWAQGRGEG